MKKFLFGLICVFGSAQECFCAYASTPNISICDDNDNITMNKDSAIVSAFKIGINATDRIATAEKLFGGIRAVAESIFKKNNIGAALRNEGNRFYMQIDEMTQE